MTVDYRKYKERFGFLRAIPKEGKPMIKRQFLEMGLPNVTEGRRLKALIDLAERLEYLKKTEHENGRRTEYAVTEKLKALGG